MEPTTPAPTPADPWGPLKDYGVKLARVGLYTVASLALMAVLSLMIAGANVLLAKMGAAPIPAVPVTPLPVPQDHPEDLHAGLALEYEGCSYESAAFHAGEHGGPAHAEGDGRPWPTKRLTYWVDTAGAAKLNPPLSADAVRASFRQAWGWWAESIDIEPAEVGDPSQALVRHRFGSIDGSLGTLAWSYLADGTLQPKEQRYDSSERWTAGPPASNLLSLPTVAAHEIGHVLALGHDDPSANALMRPSYSAKIPRELPRDTQRLIDLGYQARAAAPPPATPSGSVGDRFLDFLRGGGWGLTPPAGQAAAPLRAAPLLENPSGKVVIDLDRQTVEVPKGKGWKYRDGDEGKGTVDVPGRVVLVPALWAVRERDPKDQRDPTDPGVIAPDVAP